MFNIYKDNTDHMQIQQEVSSMSTMFDGSNCTSFSDILKHLPRFFTPDLKCTNTNTLYHFPSNINQSSNFLYKQLLEELKYNFVRQ